MGRVLALEYSLAKIGEAGIAYIAGWLEDIGYTKNDIAYMSAWIGFVLFTGWSAYHKLQRGAARPDFNKPATEKNKVEMTEIHPGTFA